MWMGCRQSPGGVQIQLYKHIDTRRYLNLDTSGHAYVWRDSDDSYVLTSLVEAIDRLSGAGSSIAVGIAAEWSAQARLTHARFVAAATDPGLSL